MPPTDRYRFGDFVLCPSTRELRRGCERVALPAKSFDCIVYLLLHRARAVGRDELVSAVWGRAEVGETVLNQTILHARRALGETSRAASAIRTVIGFGYHWVAPTEQLPSPAPDATSATGPAVNGRKGLRRHGVAVALALLIAAIGVAAAFRFSTRREVAPAARDLIVVLPVETGAATDAAWLRLGMMDLIASHLRDSGGKVMPSDGVVALARGFDTHDPAELDRFAATVGARLVVQPHATRRGTGWEVELASAGTPRVTSEAAADDPLDAALAATDALAMKLGLAVAERTAHGESSLRTLIQEIKAATLSDRLAEARALVDRATPAERADPELRFRAAKIDAQAGRTGEAETALRALLAETSAERDRILRARILDALGVIALQRSDAAAAETLHGEAIALLDAGKDEGQLGKALANRAAARFTLRRDDAALEDVARARGALEDSGDALSLLFLDANLGAVDMLRDRYRDAAPMLERAATRLEALRVHYAALNDWDAAAASRLLLLEPAAAERIRPRLGELGGRVADPRLRFGASLTSVEILIANGATSAARALLADLRSAEAPTPALKARADAIAARLALADADAAKAAELADGAFATLLEPDDMRVRERNWLTLVQAEIASGRLRDASARVDRVETLRDASPTPAARLYASLVSAELARAQRNDAAARVAFESAQAEAESDRVPLDIVTAAEAYAGWLIETGDLAAASAVVERVAPWTTQSYRASLLPVRLYHAAGLASAWSAALDRAQRLAGERHVPDAIASPPR